MCHERDFTANASHQLRTPLTGLQLTLEAGLEQADEGRVRGVLEAALATTRRLHGTIEEVCAPGGCDPVTGRQCPSAAPPFTCTICAVMYAASGDAT
ncbi:histidine kinase dimerization/phospho-acceptor domain-containing protein [Streptomyces sp. NPDC017964]|uniref:histidine kinase dimerization/phospho-acceptor domain-containing protein n=1 Tax=Streptomyces sp. NPDC017964 TaxID=3365022 RepID=UPI00378BFA3F